ncbi:MobA/MobL family protein [Candidatus Williamhamiltonella defendens]|uniref:MobA/MobL family protein n=1 Tax=Candidatus Williamhamiltonella defendens TaxID=138072 RepID=UPI0015839432|nr:MobA/MobL family protein [Candidatus Hamiltonella defensa]
MASYHCSVKSGGKWAASAHADYISRENKYAQKLGLEDLVYKSHGNMPIWAAHDPREFWQSADNFERANGSTYREIEVALPRELNDYQRIELVNEFIKEELGNRHTYQYAIHNPKSSLDGKDQPHAHIMFSERVNDGIERDPQQYFKRANSKNPEKGGAKKFRFGETPTDRKQYLVNLRPRWADIQNIHLKRHGHSTRVDHPSLSEQRIDRIPERHLGPRQVKYLSPQQVVSILERRVADRELQAVIYERDVIFDLSVSLKQAVLERDQADNLPKDELNHLIDSAMKDISEILDLQSLVDSSVNEFKILHEREQVKKQHEYRREYSNKPEIKRDDNEHHYGPERG